MRKLDKVIITLLVLIVGFQSYVNSRLLESIKCNTKYIYDATMLPFEEEIVEEQRLINMGAETRSVIGIFN